MLILALDLDTARIRHVVIFIARVIPVRPADQLVPVPALPALELVVAFAEALRRQFEPGRVVGVAVDVLQEAVEAVLHVVVEAVVFDGLAAVGGRGVFLDFDLWGWCAVRTFLLVGGWVGGKGDGGRGVV